MTMSGDVDLTGTGIVGIGKDSETQMFKGAFYGGNHKNYIGHRNCLW